jgi:hypothetical protein
LPAAFKSSIACGVQVFNCLRRSSVQLPKAFKSSIACCVQGFEWIWNLDFGIYDLRFRPWNLVFRIWGLGFACPLQAGILEFPIYEVRFTIHDLGIWILEFGSWSFPNP